MNGGELFSIILRLFRVHKAVRGSKSERENICVPLPTVVFSSLCLSVLPSSLFFLSVFPRYHCCQHAKKERKVDASYRFVWRNFKRTVCRVSKRRISMRKSMQAIVGRSDQNLSSALDTLPDHLHVHFADMNPDYNYNLIVDHEDPTEKKGFRRKSTAAAAAEFDRQTSNLQRKIDQFEVNRSRLIVSLTFPRLSSGCSAWKP